MDFQPIVNIVASYWGLLVACAVALLFAATHKTLAFSYAKKVAQALMLGAEKRTEELLLATGKDKLAWVVDKGYDLMPPLVRIVVSKPAFTLIIQALYDAAVSFAEQHTAKAEPQVVQVVNDVVDYAKLATQGDSVEQLS